MVIPDVGKTPFSQLHAIILPNKHACSIAINTVYHLVAVGRESGDIDLYNAIQSFALERVFSLAHWEMTTESMLRDLDNPNSL